MKIRTDNRRVLFTVPREVDAWLEKRVRYNASTKSAEVVRSVRAIMEREQRAAQAGDSVARPE